MIAVRSAPARTPKMGLENAVIRLVNSGTSRSPETEALMVSIPNMRVAKPRRIMPISLCLSDFMNI